MTDYSAAYGALRERVTDLARAHPTQLDTVAPATPEWRARDVLAHMAGICDDIVNGNLEGVATDPWTAAQVDKRRNWAVDRILEEWSEQGAAVEQMMDAFPEIMVGQMLFDATTHEHDIRGALGEPGARTSDAVSISYEWGTDRLGEVLEGNGTFTFVTEVGAKTVGSGDPTRGLQASRFEVIRSFTGRRSTAQMRAYEWDGEAQVERLIVADLFRPPAEDLLE
jgi:hypothetical protein